MTRSAPPSRRLAAAAALAATLALAAIPGCAGGPPSDGSDGGAWSPRSSGPPSAPREDERGPLQRAEGLFTAGDLVGTRAALEEFLAKEPRQAQARYLLARTLALLGEVRGARAEAERVVLARPGDALAWDLVAALREHQGDHRAALDAYREVHTQTQSQAKESVSSLIGAARCLLYLGEPDAALETLASARRGPTPDASAELLAWQAYRRLDLAEQAERAARVYLGLAANDPGHAERALDVRRWLAAQTSTLDPAIRQTMIDFVRAACRLRLPNTAPPEEAILARAPGRFFSYDDRPLFVTLYFPGHGPPLRGRGRGDSLASALKGAVEAIQEDDAFAPNEARESAVRIDVGRDLVPLELVWEGEGLRARPEFAPGWHGLALRADGREAYCLPGDPLTEDLLDVAACLEHAVRSAGLAPGAWETASHAVFRFESESFLSPAPGAAPRDLAGSEPLPLPEPSPARLEESASRGARWLSRILQAEGTLPAVYRAARDAFEPRPGGGADAPLVLGPRESARAVEAFATLYGRSRQRGAPAQVLLGAARHLAEPLLATPEGGAADLAARAALLLALNALVEASGGRASDVPAGAARGASGGDDGRRDGGDPYARARTRLAAELTSELEGAAWAEAPATARQQAVRALLGHAGARGPSPALLRAAEAELEAPGARPATEAVEVWIALAGLVPGHPAEQRAIAWAAAEARGPKAGASADGPEAAFGEAAKPSASEASQAAANRRLAALARAGRLASTARAPEAGAIRTATVEAAGELLSLQLAERHRYFCRDPERALGGFRRDMSSSRLDAAVTAEALLAVAACADLLGR